MSRARRNESRSAGVGTHLTDSLWGRGGFRVSHLPGNVRLWAVEQQKQWSILEVCLRWTGFHRIQQRNPSLDPLRPGSCEHQAEMGSRKSLCAASQGIPGGGMSCNAEEVPELQQISPGPKRYALLLWPAPSTELKIKVIPGSGCPINPYQSLNPPVFSSTKIQAFWRHDVKAKGKCSSKLQMGRARGYSSVLENLPRTYQWGAGSMAQ